MKAKYTDEQLKRRRNTSLQWYRDNREKALEQSRTRYLAKRQTKFNPDKAEQFDSKVEYRPFPQNPMYLFGSDGSVWSLKRTPPQKLKQWPDRQGYLTVRIYINGKAKNKYVHRIIGRIFLERPSDKHVMNHKNRNKQDNNLSNLEWVTKAYNNKHGWVGRSASKKQRMAARDNLTNWRNRSSGGKKLDSWPISYESLPSEQIIKERHENEKGGKNNSKSTRSRRATAPVDNSAK